MDYGNETAQPYLYGLRNASHDFTQEESLGKNIFTNAFPISIAQYLSQKRHLDIPLVKAVAIRGALSTKHSLTPWSEIIGADPESARFNFESIYSGYQKYTKGQPNKSDIVVTDRDGNHTRPFEVKLVVIPNSQTATNPHDEQSCEIVVRPPTIEQLSFSIANSYGPDRRQDILNIIAKTLENPMDYKWSESSWMSQKIPLVTEAASEIIKGAIKTQTPFALTAIWRTIGQQPILEENAFDVFAWTDMAFVQLFINKANLERNSTGITRPQRSLIWLISALFDYAAQGTLDFMKHRSKITFGAQTDKAGSFAGDVPYKLLYSSEFINPRITKQELDYIISPAAFDYLMPERRLDGVIVTQHLINQQENR